MWKFLLASQRVEAARGTNTFWFDILLGLCLMVKQYKLDERFMMIVSHFNRRAMLQRCPTTALNDTWQINETHMTRFGAPLFPRPADCKSLVQRCSQTYNAASFLIFGTPWRIISCIFTFSLKSCRFFHLNSVDAFSSITTVNLLEASSARTI